MRKIINLEFILLMFFLLISCSQQESKNRDKKKDKKEQVEDLKMLDNPALFMGSNFGNYIQACHRLGDYESMKIFTSFGTRKQFGDSMLLQFFKSVQFSYPLNLKAMKEENGVIILYYETTIEATKKTIQMNVVEEQDSCKLVLKELNPEKPFVGM